MAHEVETMLRLTYLHSTHLHIVGVEDVDLPVRAFEQTQNSPEVGVEHKMLEDNLDSTVELGSRHIPRLYKIICSQRRARQSARRSAIVGSVEPTENSRYSPEVDIEDTYLPGSPLINAVETTQNRLLL